MGLHAAVVVGRTNHGELELGHLPLESTYSTQAEVLLTGTNLQDAHSAREGLCFESGPGCC